MKASEAVRIPAMLAARRPRPVVEEATIEGVRMLVILGKEVDTVIRYNRSGGVDMPQLASYAEVAEAAAHADERLAKQRASGRANTTGEGVHWPRSWKLAAAKAAGKIWYPGSKTQRKAEAKNVVFEAQKKLPPSVLSVKEVDRTTQIFSPNLAPSPESMSLSERCKRDQMNASRAKTAAETALRERSAFAPEYDMTHGAARPQLEIVEEFGRHKSTLLEIAQTSFNAMVEMVVKANKTKTVTWYANERSLTNEVLGDGDDSITIMTWTHPALQVALTADLEEEVAIRRPGYNLRSVKPLARARFRRVLPIIVGIYDPGGRVQEGAQPEPRPAAGLKAVKLDMTRDQVQAFIHRMDGFLMITGAPGTGKTTVALQRIRFLFDQQRLREGEDAKVLYAPELTAVFLANRNLLSHARHLLQSELQIPPQVIHFVPDFISDFLGRVWQHKWNARPVARKLDPVEQRGREAFFNLCKAKDLGGIWGVYEGQIKARLSEASKSDWAHSAHPSSLTELASALAVLNPRLSASPGGSGLRMDSVFQRVRREYGRHRESLAEPERRNFDMTFARWLFWVYDPYQTLISYFGERLYEGEQRIKSGTAELRSAGEIIGGIREDWKSRQYSEKEESWLAWLLRFALPEERAPADRFREIPQAMQEVNHKIETRFTHVVIDEAQDLAVQESSFLASLVHPRGALTVSADFHQIVSPVHAMEDAESLKFGLPIADQAAFMQYPFRKNMRQSREIGLFLRDFYKHTFHEFPPFEPGDSICRSKPVLYLGESSSFPSLVRQMMKALSGSHEVNTVALLQVNDDPVAMQLLRSQLEGAGVSVAPTEIPPAAGALIVTTVEQAKGLEFDACMVLGLDDVEHASLNYAKNRAYVAVSRPTQRLFMMCQEFPPLLHKIDKRLYDRRDI
jgi:hypothetical protein